MAQENYHIPVMLKECLEGLAIQPGGIYVDVTFGGGGHSRAIVEKLTTGHLYGFDQDADAKVNAEGFDKRSFTFVPSNFRNLKKYLRFHGVQAVDGILADLGISSHQIDVPERGFSTRFQGPLDMRMNVNSEVSAKEVLNEYGERDLAKIFGMYGELNQPMKIARAITAYRVNKPLETIEQLKEAVARFAPRGKEAKFLAQLFQAIRLEVNEEMEVLEEMLGQCAEVLKPGGRLVVMSYHSLEDRLAKNFINKGNFEGKDEKDFYGNVIRPLEPVNRKPIVAGDDEIARNSRARSAKLRIAEKK
ncbi:MULTISPECIES: 16S rRNA (cytosine(1402)-N(4))-methyltransferase RsmH [unclassified Imperialibacter]|uniref:16S rRNA (cytosine(1402)-N(4))-methyltransferase RsmH n=1 Tax=unclassified Imperialibacter TaxID=2629706 RepID=UPI0012534C74|nr:MULTISPECIES: 16S rRNA (cytosine(1402)-N(4))-methyltransferase RsmH [unclassified Imperialibacter]CAD5284816.1 Ribosomal RNA small subunit methyltransferase H [Imperialibacter sp. 75]CAD5296618.1 Ribosomal RNA small subunit methyltransferase H [Imperialibacter sp. 89]VVT24293.1 Ribosomal RNA small subunit methyltransferase H [Imperialibacter sp. EC-SDR9]